VQLFTVAEDGITRNSVFQDRDVIAAFRLPLRLERSAP